MQRLSVIGKLIEPQAFRACVVSPLLGHLYESLCSRVPNRELATVWGGIASGYAAVEVSKVKSAPASPNRGHFACLGP